MDMDGKAGVVVKGVNFLGVREVGDPVELAVRYEEEGADELVILDITATPEGRGTFVEAVRRVATSVSIPVTVGGGVRGLKDADALFKAGADKVSVNTAAVKSPGLVEELAREYGSQSVVVAYDVELIRAVASAVRVPVIASGGAGELEHFYEAVKAGADAVLAASLFHFRKLTVGDVKRYLRERGVEVRL